MANQDLEKMYEDEQEEVDPTYKDSLDQEPIGQSNTPLQDRQQMLSQAIAQQPMDNQDLPVTAEQNLYGSEQPSANPKLDVYQRLIDELNKNNQNNEQYKNQLKTAQDAKAEKDFNTSLLMGGAQLGRGIAGAQGPVDYTPYNQMNKMAAEQLGSTEKQIKLSQDADENRFKLLKDISNEKRNMDLADQRAAQEARLAKAQNLEQKIKDQEYDLKQQENDPDSALSKRMGQMVEETIPDLKGSTSGLSYKDILAKQKFVEQRYGLDLKKLSIKAQMDQAKASNEMKKMLAEARISTQKEKDQAKIDTQNTNRVDKLNKLITSEIGSSRSAFGRAALAKQNVQNAQALLDSEKSLDDIDPRQMTEVARAVDRIVSGGNPTISGTEHLTPDTAKIRLAKLLEYATSKRQGAGAGSFLESNRHMLDRENEIADEQIRNTQGKILAGYSDLKDDPRVQQMLQAHGLPENIWDFKPKQEKDSKISDYAHKYGLSYDKAEKILRARGYSGQ